MKNIKTIVTKMKICKTRIAKERDKLRDLIGEVEMIAESADSAVRDLEAAVDSLSEYL